MQTILHDHPELERTILVETRQELLRAKRNALAEALNRGVIGDEAYELELDELDRRILVWEQFEEQIGGASEPAANPSAPPSDKDYA